MCQPRLETVDAIIVLTVEGRNEVKFNDFAGFGRVLLYQRFHSGVKSK